MHREASTDLFPHVNNGDLAEERLWMILPLLYVLAQCLDGVFYNHANGLSKVTSIVKQGRGKVSRMSFRPRQVLLSCRPSKVLFAPKTPAFGSGFPSSVSTPGRHSEFPAGIFLCPPRSLGYASACLHPLGHPGLISSMYCHGSFQ